MTVAKEIIKNNCLPTNRVKEIMKLLSFEGNKIELAKYACGYTIDQNNFCKVNDVFTFESSIEELNKYIEINRVNYENTK